MLRTTKSGIVFVHGFLGDNDEFRHIGKHFVGSHDVAYVAPQHLHTWLRESQRKWHIVGYSMGGRIALQIACAAPQLVKGLTLISASPGIASARERRARFLADRALGKAMLRGSMREFVNHWYRQPLFRDFRVHPTFGSVLAKRRHQCAAENSRLLVLFSTGAQEPLWHRLSRLNLPIGFIAGESDPKFCDIGARMAVLNPQIHRMVVAKAGHVVHWEAPRSVIKGILNVENRMAARSEL